MRFRRRASHALLFPIVCVAAFALPRPALAQGGPTDAIASGDSQCFAFSVIDEDSFLVTENIVSQMCDAVFISGSQFAQSISSVRVLFNATPFADVITFAEQTNGPPSAARAFGQAELTYFSSTRFIDGIAPPFIPGQLPLRVAAPWAMNVDGATSSNASIRLTIYDSDGAVFFSDTQTRFTPAIDTGEYVVFGAPEPLDFFTIEIESTCAAIAPVDGEANCQAIIDPLITFDQATFDATWGASSYVLADYWEIGQSPNLVPEPGFAGLIGLGGLALGWAGRRSGRR